MVSFVGVAKQGKHMTDTNHWNELAALKSKAFQILADEGVLSAIATLMEEKNEKSEQRRKNQTSTWETLIEYV